MFQPATLVWGNSWNGLLGAPEWVQTAIDMALRVKTSQAVDPAAASGWERPDISAMDGASAWDGWIKLCRTRKDGLWFPAGLGPVVTLMLQQMGCPWTNKETRERPVCDVPETATIKLRDYQQFAVDRFLEQGRGVFDMVPRAGKTRTAIEAVRQVAPRRCVWMAPTTNIVTQTVRQFDSLIGKNYAVVQKGADWQSTVAKAEQVNSDWTKSRHNRVLVMTYATARDLPPEFWEGVDMIVVDEVHHGASKTFRGLLDQTNHVFYRLGMTGTFLRSGDDDLALFGFLSATLAKVTAQDLVAAGHLVPVKVLMLPVWGPKPSGTAYTDVVENGICTHAWRQQLTAWATALSWQQKHKSVVLVSRKSQGHDLKKRLEAYIPRREGSEFQRVEYVSTDRDAAQCQRAIDAFASSDEVDVLIGTSMIGEGTDLPPADVLIYAPSGKAEVSHRQAAYRVCTAAPGKRVSVIVDFMDHHHRTLLAHAEERHDTYLSEPTFTTTVLPAPDHLPGAMWRAFTETR